MSQTTEQVLPAITPLFTELQYRLLRGITRKRRSKMDGSAYAGKSKVKTLLGKKLLVELRDKDVIDFGCAEGTETVEVARYAQSVFGVDIRPEPLETARELALIQEVADRCHFDTAVPTGRNFDIVLSLDSFEHFANPADMLNTMYSLLRPGGRVITSFGPTWYHPRGGHLFSVFPFAHLIFSERALIRWRNDLPNGRDGATRFGEVEGGLNQMTIARFEQLVNASRFRLVQLEPVPIRHIRFLGNPILRHPLVREFTTSVVRCVLERPS